MTPGLRALIGPGEKSLQSLSQDPSALSHLRDSNEIS